jgi:hypothetical protein
MKKNLDSLPISELEEMCDPRMVAFFKMAFRDPAVYRAAILNSLTRPELPVKELLEIVRAGVNPEKTWRSILALCKDSAPSGLWDLLPAVDFNADIERAARWIQVELDNKLSACTGIYLGLDTLNMRGGDGKNVEIGGSTLCEPSEDSSDWLSSDLAYGAEHLLRGLFHLRAKYSEKEWRVGDKSVATGSLFGFADYLLVLGYSGVVLGHACKLIKSNRARLFVWGFHDGDIFLLGRGSGNKFTLLCK